MISNGSPQRVRSTSRTYVELLWVLAQGGVVLLDEEPSDFILSKIVVGTGVACLVGGSNGGGGCGTRDRRELVGMRVVTVCRHVCAGCGGGGRNLRAWSGGKEGVDGFNQRRG